MKSKTSKACSLRKQTLPWGSLVRVQSRLPNKIRSAGRSRRAHRKVGPFLLSAICAECPKGLGLVHLGAGSAVVPVGIIGIQYSKRRLSCLLPSHPSC